MRRLDKEINKIICAFASKQSGTQSLQHKADITRAWHRVFQGFIALLVQAGREGNKRNPEEDLNRILRTAFPGIDCKNKGDNPNHVILITLFMYYEEKLKRLPVYHYPEPSQYRQLDKLFEELKRMDRCPDKNTLSILQDGESLGCIVL